MTHILFDPAFFPLSHGPQFYFILIHLASWTPPQSVSLGMLTAYLLSLSLVFLFFPIGLWPLGCIKVVCLQGP